MISHIKIIYYLGNIKKAYVISHIKIIYYIWANIVNTMENNFRAFDN